jgi:hypothetical protein
MAKSDHWPYCIIPWQRTVGLAVDLVQQGFLHILPVPAYLTITGNIRQWELVRRNACESSQTGEHTIPATDHIVLLYAGVTPRLARKWTRAGRGC